MEITLNGRREKHGLARVLFSWRQNIQEWKQTWTKPLPDGMMAKEKSPRSDCDEGALVRAGGLLPP